MDFTDSALKMIGAAAGLGTAAFGIVETLKSNAKVGEAGFKHIQRLLGPLLTEAVKMAYGAGCLAMLKAQYKSDQRELRRQLRQGVRVGLTGENAKVLADFVGVISPKEMDMFVSAAQKVIVRELPTQDSSGEVSPQEMTAGERMLLARYELAVDGRIEAALAVAKISYACTARSWAMTIALLIALGVGIATGLNEPSPTIHIFNSLLIGLLAVPVAPVAKDLTEAIKSVRGGLKGRSA